MNFDSSSFDPAKLSFDTTRYKWVTFHNHHRLYDLLLGYVASHLVDDKGGYRMDVTRSKTSASEENPLGNSQFGRILLKVGFGEFKFQTFQGDELYAVYQHLGKPVGGDCGPDVMQNLIIFTPSIEDFAKFLSQLVELSEKPEEGKFVCFTWMIRHQFWREEVRVNNRPMQSVVLPTAVKDRLLKDVEKFLSPKTKDFYFRNGIPYRRSYLFHGAPGTGKTSMVQALAGHFKRNVCFLLPTHPEMTDDNLREAIQSIPENSIVVFEDIDALFTKNRQNKSNKSALTFSGLLNALDGIGSPNGQIFVLTTNLRESLDHALIRNGRVDLHIEFTYAIAEQMKKMWENFYPDAEHLSEDFAQAVETALKAKNLQITTSSLQHFFITQMEATADEALAAVPSIIEEVLRNSSSSMLEAAAKNENENKKSKKNRKRDEGKGKTGDDEEDGEVREDLEVVGTAIKALTTAAQGEDKTNNGEKTEDGQVKKKKKKSKKNKNRKSEGNQSNVETAVTVESSEKDADRRISSASATTEKKERKIRTPLQTEVVYVKGSGEIKVDEVPKPDHTAVVEKTPEESTVGSSTTFHTETTPVQTPDSAEKHSDEHSSNGDKKHHDKDSALATAMKEEVKKAVESAKATASPTTADHAEVNESKITESPLPPRKDRKQRTPNGKKRSDSEGNKSETETADASAKTHDATDPAPAPAPAATTTEEH